LAIRREREMSKELVITYLVRDGLLSLATLRAQRTQFPIEVIAGLVRGAMKQKTMKRGANGKEYRT